MKKKISTIACCAMLLSISTMAYSAEGPYVNANLGLAIPSDSDMTESQSGITATLETESDTGLALGVAIGYDFGNNIRLEGEIAYQKNDFDKANATLSIYDVVLTGEGDLTGDTSSLALLANGYYDFANESAFTPFISAGLGFAKVELNDLNVPGSGNPDWSADDTVFAYQVGVGVGYAVNEKVSVDVKYRYFATSDPDFEGTESEYSSHNLYAGVRVAF